MISITEFNNAVVHPEKITDLNLARYQHLRYACNQVTIKGDVLEFGVHTGSTVNIIAEEFSNDIVFGFDSFEGLPEDWNISYTPKYNRHKKGHFALDILPNVRSNVKLIKGYFDKSIPTWLDTYHLTTIKFLHIDSDLYSSAKTILYSLNDYILPGTIIVFDELYPWGHKRYETWEENEWRALKEWVADFSRKFSVVSHNLHQQACIKIIN